MKRILFFGSLILGMSSLVSFGQNPKGGKGNGSLSIEGKMLPNVSVFTADGKEFPIAQQLKGRHAVIVFGCLT